MNALRAAEPRPPAPKTSPNSSSISRRIRSKLAKRSRSEATTRNLALVARGDAVEDPAQAQLEALLVEELPLGVGDLRHPRELARGDHLAPVRLHRPAPFVRVEPLAPERRLRAELAHDVTERIVVDRGEHDEGLRSLDAEVGDGRERLLDVPHRVRSEARAGADARRQPRVTGPDLAGALRDRRDRRAPAVRQRVGQQQLAHHLVEHEVEQVVLRRHVVVDRHRPDAEAGGDVPHRDGLEARVVGDGQRRRDDLVARDRAGSPALLARLARPYRRPAAAIAGPPPTPAGASAPSTGPASASAATLVVARLHSYSVLLRYTVR